ncbi:glutamate ABC transporter substrate-binding protein [Streptomyces sp. NPDC127084]|uniref:glutamate ABC transporter substrate-binding protein n=1 Tax=Streptomyces sp. NPDC127084 TaxID=3347133 RepID=UPI003648407F
MPSPKATAVAVFIALALTASACSSHSETANGRLAGVSDGNIHELPTYFAVKGVKIDSPTLKRAQKAGKLIIGAKDDQPFLGLVDADGKRSGFDIEIAKMVAAYLGFSTDQIEFRTVDSRSREAAISKGDIDLYVGTYTINDERKKHVGFAGPYFMAGADLLVRMTDTEIVSPQSLAGKKVCSIIGSTSLREIKKPKYGAMTIELSKYSKCVQALLSNEVDAVTTDDAILKGYIAQHPNKLRILEQPFTKEPYGIGMSKADKALREAVNDAIAVHRGNGDTRKAYYATLGLSGSVYPEDPPLERY